MHAPETAATESPLARYRAHLLRGELAYQFDPATGQAIP
jgi:hypothetical protein